MRVTNNTPNRFGPSRHGFTLVEILIVVVILGIIAAIVMPQFSNASQMARENALKDDLRYLRTQLGVFKAQHEDTPAGYPNGNMSELPDEATFIRHMTAYSNAKCEVSLTVDSAYPFGPYLGSIPKNPVTGKSGVHVVVSGDMPAPSTENFPDAGWIYHVQNQQIIANAPGTDSQGVAYADY